MCGLTFSRFVSSLTSLDTHQSLHLCISGIETKSECAYSPRHVNYCIRRTNQCPGLENRGRSVNLYIHVCLSKNTKCNVQPLFGENFFGGEFSNFGGGDFQVLGETFPPKRPVCNTV